MSGGSTWVGIAFVACVACGQSKPAEPEVETQRLPDGGQDAASGAVLAEAGTKEAPHPEAGPGHPTNSLAFKALVTSFNTTCGLRATDGTVVCWGEPLAAPTVAPPSGEVLTQLAIGDEDTCGLHPDGTVKCWGGDAHQQLEVPSGTFNAVSVADFYGCGVTTQGKIVCWGQTAGISFPEQSSLVQVVAANRATCVRASDGTIGCAGTNGVDDVPVGKTFTDITVGYNSFACGVETDGTSVCWGAITGAVTARIPPSGDHFVHLAASDGLVCGLRIDGSARCWGNSIDHSVFDVPEGERFSLLAPGNAHVCGLRKSDNSVVCWGSDRLHQTEVPLVGE